MENLLFTFTKKNPSEFLVEQRVKSNEQRAKSNKQRAKSESNEQKVTSNKQKVTSNEGKVSLPIRCTFKKHPRHVLCIQN